MNIFTTDPNPIISAQNLDNLRVIKMITESAQMMSTACNLISHDYILYKSTHTNHPCNIWIRENKNNFFWLWLHFNSLIKEYHFRGGDKNKFQKAKELKPLFYKIMKLKEYNQPDNFVNCSTYKDIEVHRAYQLCLIDKWNNDIKEPTWKNRNQPIWRNK